VLMPPDSELRARHARLLASRRRPVLSAARLIEHLRRFEWPGAQEHPIDVTTPAAQAAFLASFGPQGHNAA
jgi:hypothetical protein